MGSTSLSTREDVESWLKPIFGRKDLKSYSFEIVGRSEKGDGYLGDITFVVVNVETPAGEAQVYDVVIKSAKKSEQMRKLIPIKEAFSNEIHFYERIVPAFAAFQEARRVPSPFNNTAECHGTLVLPGAMEVLVLENLKSGQFRLHNRANAMDRRHIELVLRTYGKLHAVSFALRDQDPQLFHELAGQLADMMRLMSETLEKSENKSYYADLVSIAKARGEAEVVAKLAEMENSAEEFFRLRQGEEHYDVILHGDCWNNNFMFRYEDQAPVDVRVLDFQLSRLGSPVLDLSYFIFCCISEEDLGDFDELLRVYYESFAGLLRELGGDPGQLYPFGKLLEQWQRFGKVGLYMMPNLVKVCLADAEEVPDFAASSEQGLEMVDAFQFTVKNAAAYEKRAMPVMKFAIERKLV